MQLLTQKLRKQLPPLESQQGVEDPLVLCSFFLPDAPWHWYPIEFDGDDTFFGLVTSVFGQELCTFCLSGLQMTRGFFGMAVERDLFFSPKPLSEVRKLHQPIEGERS